MDMQPSPHIHACRTRTHRFTCCGLRNNVSAAAQVKSRSGRRGSGFFYTPFLSRNHGIQFYGFRVRAVQDSWFAVHAGIARMADGQSARFARTTPQHCVRSTRLLGSPAAILRTSRLRLGGSCTVLGSFI